MMSDIQADLKSVAEILEAADSIGVVGHVGPDGDALGSMIGLARSARLAGKNAVASFDEPFVMPEEMSFLDSSVLVPPREFPTTSMWPLSSTHPYEAVLVHWLGQWRRPALSPLSTITYLMVRGETSWPSMPPQERRLS